MYARMGKPTSGCHVKELRKIIDLLQADDEIDHAISGYLYQRWYRWV
jgi:hypothetical protein